jgi:hypothetical protein
MNAQENTRYHSGLGSCSPGQGVRTLGGQANPWYVDSSTLDLIDAGDSVDSLIYYAEVSGWLVGAGEPPKIVAITADGIRLLAECGLI